MTLKKKKVYKMINEDQFNSLMQLNSAIYIQICRVYDVLCLIADKNGADVVELRKMHIDGKSFAPEPYIAEEE